MKIAVTNNTAHISAMQISFAKDESWNGSCLNLHATPTNLFSANHNLSNTHMRQNTLPTPILIKY